MSSDLSLFFQFPSNLHKLRDCAPFGSGKFYLLVLVIVALAWLFKKTLSSAKSYRIFLFTFALLYALFLFPKPGPLLLFTLYGFILFKIVSQKFKLRGLFPVLLYFAPLVILKSQAIFPLALNNFSFLQIIGISYITFKMVQIHMDEFDGNKVNFIDYISFLLFPGTLSIGPIDRYNRYSMNISSGWENLNATNFEKALYFFLKGILFKYILAYGIHILLLSHIDLFSGATKFFIEMYAYLFYLFFDFAGYSLLAMGFGYAIGIQVPFNFDKPFACVNPKEFWQHWHKTLGDWLNDYFFKPIFKKLTEKKLGSPILRQSIALFSTFTLMGCWNGFELHYILSGMLFGIYSVVHNYYVYDCKKNKRDLIFGKVSPMFTKFISILLMFNLTAFAIYVFKGS